MDNGMMRWMMVVSYKLPPEAERTRLARLNHAIQGQLLSFEKQNKTYVHVQHLTTYVHVHHIHSKDRERQHYYLLPWAKGTCPGSVEGQTWVASQA